MKHWCYCRSHRGTARFVICHLYGCGRWSGERLPEPSSATSYPQSVNTGGPTRAQLAERVRELEAELARYQNETYDTLD